MMRDKNVTLFSSLTLFNIMKNSDLRLDAAISQNNLMTSTEKKMLASTDTCIMISRSSVLFDSIIFKSNLSDISLSIFYIRPIYLQTKTLTITNVDFIEISGRLMNSLDPFNFNLENITVDCYQLMSGFTSYNGCNYPEANLFDYQIIKIVPIMDSFLSYFGPGNFTLDSVNSSIYATSNQLYPPIWLAISPYCIPSDSVQRQMSLNNISMTLKDNISKNRLSSIFFNYQIAGYTREITINYSNGYHFDIQYSFYPILVIFVSPTVYVTSNF